MLIGVPLETAAGETRVAVTPETAKKLKAQGTRSACSRAPASRPASPTRPTRPPAPRSSTRAGAFGADLVLKVRAPERRRAAR